MATITHFPHAPSIEHAQMPAPKSGQLPARPQTEVLQRRELAERTGRRLREAAASGGETLREAQAETILDHLWLARTIAARYRHRGEDDDDLLQVAYAGLVEAVQRFDPEQGDFLAFAVPTITGVMKRHFRDHGWLVRPPRRTQELVLGLRREWSSLAQELGQMPTDGDLAQRLGADAPEVTEAMHASQGYRSVSMEALVEGHPRLAAVDGEEYDLIEAQLIVRKAIRQLDASDRRLVWMRFYQGRSQSDIAAELGTSQMQISRRLVRLLGKLRDIVGAVEEAPALAS